jgi:hypothetical protein
MCPLLFSFLMARAPDPSLQFLCRPSPWAWVASSTFWLVLSQPLLPPTGQHPPSTTGPQWLPLAARCVPNSLPITGIYDLACSYCSTLRTWIRWQKPRWSNCSLHTFMQAFFLLPSLPLPLPPHLSQSNVQPKTKILVLPGASSQSNPQ